MIITISNNHKNKIQEKKIRKAIPKEDTIIVNQQQTTMTSSAQVKPNNHIVAQRLLRSSIDKTFTILESLRLTHTVPCRGLY